MHRLSFLLALFLMCFASASFSQTLATEIKPQSKVQRLCQNIELLSTNQEYSVSEVSRLNDWHPFSKERLIEHPQPRNHWFRFRLENNSDQELLRWLEFGSIRMQLMYFYALDESQQIISHGQAGSLLPKNQHAIKSPIARLFELNIPSHRHIDVYVHVQTATEIIAAPTIWQPDSFREYAAHRNFVFTVPLAIILSVGTIFLIFGLATRDILTILAGSWAIIYGLYEMSFLGYLHYFILPTGSALTSALPLFFGLLSVTAMFTLSHVALRLNRRPYWSYLSAAIIIYYFCMALYGFADLHIVIFLAHFTVPLAALSQPIILLFNWKHRQQNSTPFLLAIIVFYIILLTRTLYMVHMMEESIIYTPFLWHTSLAVYLISLVIGFHKRASSSHKRELHIQKQLIELQKLQQKHLEETVRSRTIALQESVIELKEANKSKDDFLARVSHDLRSPLTSILGFAELIKVQGENTSAEKANIIMHSGKRLLSLIDDLVEFSSNRRSKQALYPTLISSQSFFSNIIKEGLILAQEQNNQLHLDISATLPKTIFIDERRVYQIIINLISNACKFTQNGNITLQVEYVIAQQQLIITVSDTGVGIAEQQLTNIFDPFEKLSQNQSMQGLGLGLAIVKQWVDRMQGHILVNSTVGVGSEFTVHLPMQEVDVSVKQLDNIPDYGEHSAIDGKQLLIWLIEDTPHIQNLLRQTLLQWNFSVQCFDCVADTQHALFANGTKQPCLVLTDANLPDGDGCSLANTIKKQWPETSIILLSAGLIEIECQHGEVFFDTFYKPVDFARLSKSISNALGLNLTTPANMHNSPEKHKPATTKADKCSIHNCSNEEDLNILSELLDLNAISDVIVWAQKQSEKYPHCADTFRSIRDAAFSADLQKLRQLANKLQQDAI